MYLRVYIYAISWRRVCNVFLLYFSFWWSKIRKKVWLKGRPLAFSYEPLNICNLRCPECPTGLLSLKRPKGTVSDSQFREVVSSLKADAFLVNLYFQGEPLMHPGFSSLVSIAKSAKLVTSTSTNGHYLNERQAKKIVESELDILIVSLDGMMQETYEKYRVGGELDKVLQGIKNVVREKQIQKSIRPIIIAQFLAFRHNEHEIEFFENWAYDLGVNEVQIKTAQIYNVNDKLKLLPRKSELTRYALNDKGNVVLKGEFKNSCWKQWSSCVFTWDGDLVPCCFDKDGNYKIGNVFQDNFKVLWQEELFNRFRLNVLLKQSGIDICRNCPVAKK